MSLPSKLTSYYAAGRPLIAAVPRSGTTAREVERSRAGLVSESGERGALLDVIDPLDSHPLLYDSLAAARPSYVRDALTEERALARAEAFVAAVLSPGASGRDSGR